MHVDVGLLLLHVGLSYCATIGRILPIAFLGGQNGHMFIHSRRYNARLLEQNLEKHRQCLDNRPQTYPGVNRLYIE